MSIWCTASTAPRCRVTVTNTTPHGNRTTQTENNGRGPETTTNVYDDLDRLTQVDYPDVPAGRATSTLYTYDAAYNRTGEVTEDAGSATLNDLTYGYNHR